MMQVIKTGLLSYGMSGRIFHAPFIHQHSGFKFHSVLERTERRVPPVYQPLVSYGNMEDLLNDPQLELLIINTPNYTHYQYAKQALEAGKHVLIEKPFAASSAQATELFELGRAMGKYVMAYQNRRWDSDFQSVKEVIASGKLGQLIEVNFRFDRYRRELSVKTFKELKVPATGLTYDLGPHLLDQVISLFGRPLHSGKTTGIYRPDSEVDDYVSYQLNFEGNIHVNVTAGLLTADPQPAFILHGTHGSFVKNRTDIQELQLDRGMMPAEQGYGEEISGSEGKLTHIDTNGLKTSTSIPAPKGNYMNLFDAVYRQIRHQEIYPVKEDEIICQMELLEMESES